VAGGVLTAQRDRGDDRAGHDGGRGQQGGGLSASHWCAPCVGLGKAVGQDFERAQHVVVLRVGNAVQQRGQARAARAREAVRGGTAAVGQDKLNCALVLGMALTAQPAALLERVARNWQPSR
jgi:hypothetical protein